jgi:arylsulfatase A-like enzyme
MRLLNMNMETQCTPSRSSLMTGRFSIRSGTYAVPFGGVPEGLTQWEITIAKSLSEAGYATALYGKWHLGSHDGRLGTVTGTAPWRREAKRPQPKHHAAVASFQVSNASSRRTRIVRREVKCRCVLNVFCTAA